MKVRFFNVVLRAVTLGVKFTFILSLAIFLPPAEVGLYGLITVTVFYSIYFVGFEFYTYSTRDMVARPKSEWSGLLTSQLAFFCLMYLVVLPASSILFVMGMLPWTLMASIVCLVVLEHLSTELMRLLVAIEKPLLATLVIFVKHALWAVCFTLAMWLDPDFRNIPDLLLFWMIGTFSSIFIGVWPLLKLNWAGALSKLDWRWVKAGVIISVPLLLSSIAVRSLFTFDRYAFEALNGLALLGAYSVYMGVASAMLSFMESGVFVFYYPRMMKAYKERNLGEFQTSYRKLARQSVLWLPVLTAGAGLAGITIFPLLEERVYAENLPLFAAVIVAMAIFIIGYVFQHGLYTMTRDGSIIAENVTGLILAALTLFLFASHSEYWSVTLAMLVGSATATALKYWISLATRRELLLE
ncbi:hypothetical protein LPB19_15100 [Marinobacter salinisoli]|uniref:Polysaccharide biosynthesis protein n=1 Tax=Marinobacter salinisoli TaxID=2769486 RepID=A0ABX7MQA1_9GAMM|nr:hypothetical protein [Marinobacter salinisoli]QSP94486.1 hypothetical protein LPB19_15100 [Marinobacter salinisoli]